MPRSRGRSRKVWLLVRIMLQLSVWACLHGSHHVDAARGKVGAATGDAMKHQAVPRREWVTAFGGGAVGRAGAAAALTWTCLLACGCSSQANPASPASGVPDAAAGAD